MCVALNLTVPLSREGLSQEIYRNNRTHDLIIIIHAHESHWYDRIHGLAMVLPCITVSKVEALRNLGPPESRGIFRRKAVMTHKNQVVIVLCSSFRHLAMLVNIVVLLSSSKNHEL